MKVRGRADPFVARFGAHLNRTLYEEVLRGRARRPSLTLAGLGAFVLAATVHALTLVVAAAGVILVLTREPVVMIVGVLVLVLAFALRPRPPKLASDPVPRSATPQLHGLTDRVTAAIGAPRFHGVVIEPGFDGATMTAGWRRRRYLILGAALITDIDGQAMAALLGHEAGHQVNGDTGRSAFVGYALQSLERWYYILRPQSLTGDGSVGGVLAFPIYLVLLVMANVVAAIARLEVQLIYRTAQRAEYYADALAVKVAGRDGAVEMLERVGLQQTFTRWKSGLAINPDQDFWSAWSAVVRRHSRADLRGEIEKEPDARIDSTHPPTLYRLKVVESMPTGPAAVVVSASELAAIEKELAALHPALQRQLATAAAAALYR